MPEVISPSSPALFIALSTAVSAAAAFALLRLFRARRRAWNSILAEAFEYHRYHLGALSADRSGPEASREIAQEMLQVLRMQFEAERKRYRGLRDLFAWRRTGTSSLASCSRIFFRLYRDSMFGISGAYDERLYRLLNTMQSALARFFLLNSALGLPAVAYMDAALLLARAGFRRRGPLRLYAEIAFARNRD